MANLGFTEGDRLLEEFKELHNAVTKVDDKIDEINLGLRQLKMWRDQQRNIIDKFYIEEFENMRHRLEVTNAEVKEIRSEFQKFKTWAIFILIAGIVVPFFINLGFILFLDKKRSEPLMLNNIEDGNYSVIKKSD